MPNLRNAATRAYRSTPVFTLDTLLAEETRWQRKATIARNKLASVRRSINRLAMELAKASIGLKDES